MWDSDMDDIVLVTTWGCSLAVDYIEGGSSIMRWRMKFSEPPL